MSALALRESSVYRDPDQSANAVKLLIENLNTLSPVKFIWLDLFASFRILRNLYANPETEFTGLRLLAWSNLFDTLHQKITQPPQKPITSTTISHDEVFSILSLEKYASDVLCVLVDEAHDILNRHGADEAHISEIGGAQDEIRRDFQCMILIERHGHLAVERSSMHGRIASDKENLVRAFGDLDLEFSDPADRMNAMVHGMKLH